MTDDLQTTGASGLEKGGQRASSESVPEAPEEARAKRLDRIRSQLAAGQYRIDSEEIASKLMVRLTRAPENGK